MNCKAQINDELGNKYKCSEEATKKIIIETFVPHLQRIVKKERYLCNHHAARLLSRHRYQIKYCGKQTTLTVEELQIDNEIKERETK